MHSPLLKLPLMLQKKILAKMNAYNLTGKFIIKRVCDAQENTDNLLKRVGVPIRSNKDKDEVQPIFWHVAHV